MKTSKRCGYSGKDHYHTVEGANLCEDCYNAWLPLLRDIFRQFLGTKLRIEEEPRNEKII